MDQKEKLKRNIVRSIEGAGDSCALLFSGGVDSTLIASVFKSSGKEFTCYTAGFPDSKDVKWSERTALEMGLRHVVCGIGNIEETVKQVIDITGLRSPVHVSISIPIFTACSQVEERVVVTGMGADELFAGYSRFRSAKDLESLSWRMLEKLEGEDLARDRAVASHFGLGLRTPYLDAGVIRVAMQLPDSAKISDGQNKIILREIARGLGVPESVCDRKKDAAQYGSGAMKELKRLARSRKFKSVTAYLESI